MNSKVSDSPDSLANKSSCKESASVRACCKNQVQSEGIASGILRNHLQDAWIASGIIKRFKKLLAQRVNCLRQFEKKHLQRE